MLDLQSPDWATLSHAYGDASDVPQLIAKLRAAGTDEWDDANGELMSTILHQGDVYTATYAAAPHLVQYAAELGPGKQSDELLCAIAYASRGGPGAEVPSSLEDDWEDAQDDARDLILERLSDGHASEDCSGHLIAGMLYLSGEWAIAGLVDRWCSGSSIVARCANCSQTKEVFWYDGGPKQSTNVRRRFWQRPKPTILELPVKLTDEPGITPTPDMEFENDQMVQQILGLAVTSGHMLAERQMRTLFGTIRCESCGHVLPLTSALE